MTHTQSLQTTTNEAAYRRFLKYYYLQNSFYDCIFAYTVYTLFFSLRGQTILEISLLLSWWIFSSIILEIPTGALADTWSRRKMLALAPLMKSLCYVIWFLAGDHFYLYALGFLFWSLGSTFASGTSEALLYDTLTHYDRKDDYERVLGRRKVYNYTAHAVASISGGFIAAYRIDWAILLSVIPLLLSAFFGYLIQEAPKVESTREIGYLQHFRLAVHELRNNRILLYLFLYLLGISILGDIEEFDQLYYKLVGLPIQAFGIVSFVWASTCALGAYLAHRMKERVWVLYVLPVVASICLAMVWRFPSIPVIGLLLLAYAVIVPVRILVDSRIQHSIAGVSRATITSAVTFLIYTCAIGMPVILGVIARLWHLPAIYLTGAIQLLLVAVWAFGMRKRMNGDDSNAEEEQLQRQKG